VLGLVGQTHGNAIVVESPAQIEKLDKEKDTYLYSQTTKSLEGYRQLTEAVKEYISPEKRFESYDTVCRQVANRMK
jgi:4-hydroxy-3-methylbut-2-enyl diphosphate reductase